MRLKVLAVDDDLDFLALLEYNLKSRGFEFGFAVSGLEGLHKARAILPDVILLDLLLPDLDGISICEILSAQPSTCDIPVIMCSALNWSAANPKNNRIRIAQYFQKPVDLRSLHACLSRTCEERRNALSARLKETRS